MIEVSREEFQNLYNEVKEIHAEVSNLCSRFAAFQAHVITTEIAVKTALELKEKQLADSASAKEYLQKQHFAIIAIIVSIISVIIGVVFKIAM